MQGATYAQRGVVEEPKGYKCLGAQLNGGLRCLAGN